MNYHNTMGATFWRIYPLTNFPETVRATKVSRMVDNDAHHQRRHVLSAGRT